MRGWGGGAVFLAMQVLEIPAGGRGFPLVNHYLPCEPIYRLSKTSYSHIFVVLRHLFSYYFTFFVLFSHFLP